jgi:FKBP-type peptidyl-prolyl cis-trans isomerase
MKHLIKFGFVIFSLFFIVGCVDLENESEKKQNEEIKYLDHYIALLQDSLKTDTSVYDKTIHKLTSGVYYIIEKQATDTTLGIEYDNCIEINFVGRMLKSGLAFHTNNAQVAKANSLRSNVYVPGTYYLKYNPNYLWTYGFYYGMSTMKKGAKYKIFVPSSLGFGSTSYGAITEYSSLVYEVELVNVVKEPKSADSLKIELMKNNIGSMEKFDTLESSIYYKETTKGIGNVLKLNDKIDIKYRMGLIDGRLIKSDSSYSDTTLTMGDNYLLPNGGLDCALRYLKVGSKAKLIIPYNLAFGENGAGNIYNQVVIPIYTSLVLDVEVEKLY